MYRFSVPFLQDLDIVLIALFDNFLRFFATRTSVIPIFDHIGSNSIGDCGSCNNVLVEFSNIGTDIVF